jgi:hypothetical protein
MIEILETEFEFDIDDGTPHSRYAQIAITNGGTTYEWARGGLPLEGDLQSILDAEEAQLLAAATEASRLFDPYELTERRVIKALALVILDEINALRQRPLPVLPMPARTAGQIETAIKNKLKGM